MGSVPVVPPLPGIGKAVICLDAIECTKPVGKSVIVVGGGLVGCEMALEYAMEGKKGRGCPGHRLQARSFHAREISRLWGPGV